MTRSLSAVVFGLILALEALNAQTLPTNLLSAIDQHVLCLEGQVGRATKLIFFDDTQDSAVFSLNDYNSLVEILRSYRINHESLHHYQRQTGHNSVIYRAITDHVQLREMRFDLEGSELVMISWLHLSKSILGREETSIRLDCKQGFSLVMQEDKLWFGKHRSGMTISIK